MMVFWIGTPNYTRPVDGYNGSPEYFYIPGATLMECPHCHFKMFVGDIYVNGEVPCPHCKNIAIKLERQNRDG